MNETTKVLHMTFATAEGGTFKISLGNTRDDLTPAEVKRAMDDIVDSNVFETSKGAVVGKARAYLVTQESEELDVE